MMIFTVTFKYTLHAGVTVTCTFCLSKPLMFCTGRWQEETQQASNTAEQRQQRALPSADTPRQLREDRTRAQTPPDTEHCWPARWFHQPAATSLQWPSSLRLSELLPPQNTPHRGRLALSCSALLTQELTVWNKTGIWKQFHLKGDSLWGKNSKRWRRFCKRTFNFWQPSYFTRKLLVVWIVVLLKWKRPSRRCHILKWMWMMDNRLWYQFSDNVKSE